MKLSVDINVVKVFLEISFYHHVKNCCGRFRHAFTLFTPPPLNVVKSITQNRKTLITQPKHMIF